MTVDEFVDFLQQKVTDAGTQALFAKQIGISEQYLSDILKSHQKPGKKLLNALGFMRVVTYIPIDASTPASQATPHSSLYWEGLHPY